MDKITFVSYLTPIISYNFFMKISKNLKALAKEFNKKNAHLYIVGGFVRDDMMGRTTGDIDLASRLLSSDVEEICQKLNFGYKCVNKTLGTMLITTKSERYEYTTFRKESYNGLHTPEKTEFVQDIEIDTLRRDFTINAIYYDILDDKYIDLTSGKKDILNKIIRTVNDPEITLKDDGLRILRAIRFASTFNFAFDPKTYKSLKHFRENLLHISKERIVKELSMLCIADLRHGEKNTIFLNEVNNLRLLPLIFNHSLNRIKELSKADIITFYNIPQVSRVLGFYILVTKSYSKGYLKLPQLKFVINMLFGLDGLNTSKEQIRLIEKVYYIYENLEYNVDELNASINYLTLKDENKQLINNLLSATAKSRLDEKLKIIKSKNLPLSISELDICAEDLIKVNIERRCISVILNTLFNLVIEMQVSNEKNSLINVAKEINKTFSNLSQPKGAKKWK